MRARIWLVVVFVGCKSSATASPPEGADASVSDASTPHADAATSDASVAPPAVESIDETLFGKVCKSGKDCGAKERCYAFRHQKSPDAHCQSVDNPCKPLTCVPSQDCVNNLLDDDDDGPDITGIYCD